MDGILVINKPGNITSYDVIRFIKRNFNLTDKIGHAGTLDPLARGVLLVCIGKGTKMSRLFMNFEKEYIARLKLGIKTDTDDIEGKIIEEKFVETTEKEVTKTIKSFKGEIQQVPPIVSAIKHKGKPLYKHYREGNTVKPHAKTVTVKEIEIISIDLPEAEFRVVCSKGTYIRSLCRDIGEKIGCGGTQISLIRTKVGPFIRKNSITPEKLKEKGLGNCLISLQEVKRIINTP
jgi:tRNA pseudouridine55 synthase